MASVLVGSGCVAHQHTTGHPAPVPDPAPHRVDAREAKHIALDVAAQRGYRDAYVRDLKWKDHEFRWDVKTEGYVARKKSKLDLWIDGETGEILKLKDQADKGKHGHAGQHGAIHHPPNPPTAIATATQGSSWSLIQPSACTSSWIGTTTSIPKVASTATPTMGGRSAPI